MYPRIKVDPDVLYVDEGDLLTSAGSAAGIDLCLHIVRKDFGESVASQVARRLVVYPHRDGGQAQFVDRAVPKEDRPWLAKLLEWTQNHLGEKLSVKRLAKQAGMSNRTLSRRFAEEVATSPIEWLIGLRLARAEQMLEKTARSVDEIAYDTGFGSAPTYGTISGAVLTRARLPIARIFGEIPAAKEPDYVRTARHPLSFEGCGSPPAAQKPAEGHCLLVLLRAQHQRRESASATGIAR
jgi:AraC-like DNA-binding protein